MVRLPGDDEIARVLSRRPVALLTDIDGTIAPIAATPEGAHVDERCRKALRALVGKLDVVVAVSGRAAEEAARMVGVPGVVFIGNHGLETYVDGKSVPVAEAVPFIAHIARFMAKARERVQIDGAVFEDKGVTASIHYRLAGDAARELLFKALQPLAEEEGLRLTEGRKVIEIRPPVDGGKGTATRRLVEDRGIAGAFFIGDDTTDVDAFRVLAQMRAAGRIAALVVGVAGSETPPAVIEHSDAQVSGVEGTAWLLERIANQAGF